MAAQNGHGTVVEKLIGAGASVDQPMQDGATPLFIAAQNGHVDATRQLLLGGADPKKEFQSWTPLMIAEHKGHAAVTALLRNPPVYSSAQNGHGTVVEKLIGAGASVDQPMQDGATPLFIAAQNGHVDATRQLLLGGADPKKEFQSWTPLMIAEHKGRATVLALLRNPPVTLHAVMMVGGATVEIKGVSLDWKVSQLNAEIAKRVGGSAELQRLVVAGAALDDGAALLSSCGVGEGTDVHVVAQTASAAAERRAAAAAAVAATAAAAAAATAAIAEGQPPGGGRRGRERRSGGWMCCASRA